MKTGIELIAQERNEQIEKHNRTLEYDKLYNNHYQLSEAAGLLTLLDSDDLNIDECCPCNWNGQLFKKMMSKSYTERLVIAGALIAAELDRLQNSDL